jgi:hypothetical protein
MDVESLRRSGKGTGREGQDRGNAAPSPVLTSAPMRQDRRACMRTQTSSGRSRSASRSMATMATSLDPAIPGREDESWEATVVFSFALSSLDGLSHPYLCLLDTAPTAARPAPQYRVMASLVTAPTGTWFAANVSGSTGTVIRYVANATSALVAVPATSLMLLIACRSKRVG